MNFVKYTLLLFAISLKLYSQDTVKVLTYNILNYGNITSYCSSVNNNYLDKEKHLKNIFDYINADIIGINEIYGNNDIFINRLLDTVLNNNSVNKYNKAGFFNSISSPIISILFFNKHKFTLYSENAINGGMRDICFYTLYYNSPDLAQNDTVFITFITLHLKAGSTNSDQALRANETSEIMTYIDNNIRGNIVLMGDLNVQKSSEASFQNLINHSNPSIRFYDPVNKLGNWHNNPDFSNYHTQSSWLITNGCAASGGLDDRFDFILINEDIKYSIKKVSYVNNSYTTIGQDGNRFDLSVSNPINNSAPNYVIDALQNASDHLPVSLKLRINQTPNTYIYKSNFISRIAYLDNSTYRIYINNQNISDINYSIIDITGKQLLKSSINISNNNYFDINLSMFPQGIYFSTLHINNSQQSIKLIVP